MNRSRQIRHSALGALVLALALSLATAAASDYPAMPDPNAVQLLDSVATPVEVVTNVGPYDNVVAVRATLREGPFAGVVLRGRADPGAEDRLADVVHLHAVLDTSTGEIDVSAGLAYRAAVGFPYRGRAAVLTGRSHAHDMSIDAVLELWPTLVTAMWPVLAVER